MENKRQSGAKYRYSHAFMLQAVRVTLEENISYYDAAQRFQVNRTTIMRWVNKFSSEIVRLNAIGSMPETTENNLQTTEEDSGTVQYQRALEQANLKILALETLLDIAEEKLKYPIRKNFGAKQ